MNPSLKWSVLASAAVVGACGVVDDAGAPAPTAETTQGGIVAAQKQLEPLGVDCGNIGFLKYTYQAIGGQEVAPFAKGTSAKWVRASSSKPFSVSGCHSTFFAVEVDDPPLNGRGIYLDQHIKCASG
jgi:hypothetical protein